MLTSLQYESWTSTAVADVGEYIRVVMLADRSCSSTQELC
jgi:hypothetical protein